MAACGSSSEPAEEHGEEGEPAKGPHNGRLLKDGDFAVEITIFEDGVPPQFRVYPTKDGKPVDAKTVQLTVTLKRLGGEVNTFPFKAEKDYLTGQGVVEEPHSFDVEVVAVEGGKRHVWRYASPEGRTRITADAAKAGGIEIETVGPATIGETRELYGTVQLATTARSEIRGQFPGRIVSVTKQVGDTVKRGQLLARIESSESLQVYPVYSTVSGVVAERNGVLFVNDSKATNAASTAPALAAYPRVHWIVGGLPKSDNLDECIPNFGHVVKAYTIGEAGPLFHELLSPHMPVERSEMMGTAVCSAAAQAEPGDVIMLSPACASFDQFKDFEARGDAFRAIVEAL